MLQPEAFCATYNPDVFVVVYSVVERRTFQAAEDILLFLWKSDYMTSRGVVLVGNKADLERKREVSTSGEFPHAKVAGRRWAVIAVPHPTPLFSDEAISLPRLGLGSVRNE